MSNLSGHGVALLMAAGVGGWPPLMAAVQVAGDQDASGFGLVVKVAVPVLLLLGLGVGWNLEKGRQKKALRESEERFKLVMNTVEDGLWDWDFSTGEIYLSPGFYTLLGWQPGAFPGRRKEWFDRIHPDDRDRVVTTVDERLRNGSEGAPQMSVEFRMRTLGGGYRHVLCRGNVVAWGGDGNALRGVGTLTDITRRKTAEEQQELSRKALKTVLDSIDAFVYVADMKTYELLFLNRYGQEQWGDLTGETCWQVLQDDQDGPCSFCTNSKLLDESGSPRGPYRWEFQNTVNNRWCDISDRAVHWIDGRIVRLEIATDITDRKAAEAELVKARFDAEQANRFKSSFLANMSHEIRTPLSVIVGMSHLLQQTRLSPEQDGYAANIRDSAHVLLGVIDDILDLSRIESGKLVIEQTPFLLCEVLERLAGLLGTKAASKGVELVFTVDPRVPPVLEGDPLRLEQVLINLVQNALKFTEAGEVEVGIGLGRDAAADGEIAFWVCDTGVGIEGNRLESLFEAFVQGDSSTSRRYGGSGLGLTICKHLVELMGGRIEAESTVGVGSRFSFFVPFALPTNPPPSQKVDLKGLRALVVDKNTNVRRALGSWLQAVSAVAEQASSPGRALELAEKAVRLGEPYDILIIDGEMAGPDLATFSDGLADAVGAAMPVIIIMSPFRGRRDELIGRFQAERSVFLAKPVCPSAFMAALREALDPEAAARLAAGDPGPLPQASILVGKQVLVVEDDPINQQVVAGLLESFGIDVTLADGGRSAIAMVANRSFDLILMDVQMPEMDGMEATRRLRDGVCREDLPIVALTAHAMKGDRDRCIAAGMNDHLAKPIDPNQLAETLTRWIGAGRSEVADGERGFGPDLLVHDGQSSAASRGAYLDIEEGVRRVGGERSTYLRLLRQFVTDHGGAGDAIRRAVARDDLDHVRRLIHTLQGVAGNLGADRLGEAARGLGDGLGTEPEWQVQRRLVELESAIAGVVDIVGSMPDDAPTTSGSGDSEQRIRSLAGPLQELATMLRDGNADSLDRLRSLRAGEHGEALDKLLARAEAQVRTYDHEQALQLLTDAARTLGIDLKGRRTQ